MSGKVQAFNKDFQYFKFCSYGFLKNLRFYEPFLVLFFLDNGLTFLEIGILYSIREIGRNLLEIPAGILSDAFGRKRTLIASFAFYTFSFIIYYFSDRYAGFVLAMVIYSLGDAFRTGTHKAMIFDYLSLRGWVGQKVYYYGHTRSWSQLGSATSALLAALFVFLTGSYRPVFLFSAIPCILDILLISSYPPVLNGSTKTFRKGTVMANLKQVLSDFYHSFRDRRMVKAIFHLSAFTGFYTGIRDYLQPVLEAMALSLPVLVLMETEKRTSVVIGGVYFIIYFITSFASRGSGVFANRFGTLTKPLNLTLLIGLLAGILCGLFYLMDYILLSVAFFLLIYMIENLRKPIGIAFVSENVNKNVLASVLSAESQAHSLLAALIAPLAGWFADLWGIGPALTAVSLILILFWPLFFLKASPAKQ
ncbi:MAG: MFS transporter [Bacteroidales bacterium]|nr:MFS transporter [Bacteroidales bacterium]